MSTSELNDETYCTEVPENLVLGNTLIKADIHKKIINFSLLSKNYEKNLSILEAQSIIPSETQCISEANYTQGTLVQNYCVEVTTQALITPPDPEFNNVPQIQRDAQEHANSWLSGLNGDIVGINTGLKQFCNLIITYKNDIDQLVDDVVNNHSGAKENFIEQVGFLRDQADSREKKIKILTTKLGDFRQDISQDGTNFKSVKNKADIKYNTNTGEMAELKKTITALQKTMKDANDRIVGGGALVFTGLLVIVVGAVASLPSGGATAAIISAGVGIIGGGSGLIGQAVDTLNKANEQLSQTYTRYSTLQQTCSLLEAINKQLTSLLNGNEQSVRAVQAITLALSLIAQNLTGIIDNIDLIIDNVEAGAILKRLLKTFVANAESLKEIYVKYEQNGILPVQPTRQVWNSLFPYRSKPVAYSDTPISMEEFAFLIDRKLAWQRRHSGVYVPQAA